MGSIQDLANSGFDLAQNFINFGLSTFQGFFDIATGSLKG